MSERRFLHCLLLVATLACLSGCHADPPFKSGIRIISEEAISTIGNSKFRVPGVSYYGNSLGQPGSATNNGAPVIEGVTGANGIGDNPQALTDVDWYLHFSYASVIPSCPDHVDPDAYVNPIGAVFEVVCFTLNP